MKERITILLTLLLVLATFSHAEDRYLRYRLLTPQVSSIATISVQTHVQTDTLSWAWDSIEQPGIISYAGLYLPKNTWSVWRKLPGTPFWGTVYLNVKAADPLKAVKVEFQLATWPSDDEIVKQFTESSETGNSVGFIIPPGGIIEGRSAIETLSESYARRRKVAEGVAIPDYRQPKLLSFSGSGVNGNRTLKGSDIFEFGTTRMIGFNTYSQRNAGRFTQEGTAASDITLADQLNFSPDDVKRMAYVLFFDEPAWYSGFWPMWTRTNGNEGFHKYLKDAAVDPALFGKKSMDEVGHIPFDKRVPADAPIEQRRLWYWSCRYTFDLDADNFAAISHKILEKYPTVNTTVNFSDHGFLLGEGIATGGPDVFAWGRRGAVTMQWSEDWLFAGLTSWGNGMYQKMGFLTDIMRSAQRYQYPDRPLGYHVVSNSYNPFTPYVDMTISARVNLLLGRGVKYFSFFNYGPTSSGTSDWWADDAATMRGTAEAIHLVGGAHVEPFLWNGKPGPADACIFYSIPAKFWQNQNNAGADNVDIQLLYCMLAQEQVQTDAIDTTDLDRWVKQYKVAYLVDQNIPAGQIANLRKWVEAGGVLVLWPQAGTRNEYNEPLAAFPAEPGKTQLGNGWIIRFDDRPAAKWWDRVVEANKTKTFRPVILDLEYRHKVSAPALELAKVHQPVTANGDGIDIRTLYSKDGIAVPVVNLQYLFPSEHQKLQKMNGKDVIINPTTETTFPDGCVRYTKEKPLTVTLNDAEGIVQVYSSRLGNLAFKRVGTAISVSFPLDTTDILIFSKVKIPVEKYPWNAPIKP